MRKDEPQTLAKFVTLGDVALPLMFDSFAVIRPVKMRWILTGVAACFLLAVTPASAQDYEATRHAAEQGDADAQFALGLMYGADLDVLPRDDAESARWYRLAVEQGHLNVQFTLGGRYGTGESVPQDYVSAHMWLNLAAATGLEDARKAARMSPPG